MFEHLRARIFNAPLMIAQPRLDAILAAIGPRLLTGIRLEMPSGEPAPKPVYRQERRVGVIPVHGVLVARAGQMAGMSEPLMSYQEIGAMLNAALADPDIAHIVLDINSYGGEAEGVMDLSDRIYQAREQKPITAVIAGNGLSAAYAIASAADRVLVTRSSAAGSIGVICTHVDESAFDAKEGFRYTHLYAGTHKADLTPHAPLSDEARAWLQADVNALYEIFVTTVARNRNLSVDAVKATQARTYMGATALGAGLADEVASFDAALSSIVAGVSAMPPETAVPPAAGQAQADAGALAKASALAIMRACTESGFPNLAAKALESGWSLDEVKARLGNAAEIKRLCATARLPDRATGYIEAGLKPDEVRAQLFDALAAADQATQVNTTQSPGNFNMPGGIKGDPARQREALTQLNPNKVYAARRELMKGG